MYRQEQRVTVAAVLGLLIFLLLGVGLAVFMVFDSNTSSATVGDAAPDTTGADSGFPWVIMILIITMITSMIAMTMARNIASASDTKPKRKVFMPKRKRTLDHFVDTNNDWSESASEDGDPDFGEE